MINVVILAAGQGKRMRSSLPKVLQPLAGTPMLGHVLQSVKQLADVSRTVVVVGCGAEAVKAAFGGHESLRFALQQPQMGTGHALQCALPELDPAADYTLVLLGDVPLVQPETIERLMAAAGDGMAILTTVLRNPTGYGRILRQKGRIVAIVEQKDATEGQKQIREVNTGIMLLPTARLAGWLSELKTSNAQGEYYLTDVIGLAVRDGVRINSARPRRSFEVEGGQLQDAAGAPRGHLAGSPGRTAHRKRCNRARSLAPGYPRQTHLRHRRDDRRGLHLRGRSDARRQRLRGSLLRHPQRAHRRGHAH